jgi:hypothetical protein
VTGQIRSCVPPDLTLTRFKQELIRVRQIDYFADDSLRFFENYFPISRASKTSFLNARVCYVEELHIYVVNFKPLCIGDKPSSGSW